MKYLFINRNGFSYIELVIAMALFSVTLLAVFPTISQAANNLRFAQVNYMANNHANSIMLLTRDKLHNGSSYDHLQNIIIDFANTNNINYFSIWVSGIHNIEFHYSHDGSSTHGISSTDISQVLHNNLSTIVVALWCSQGNLLGHSHGILTPMFLPLFLMHIKTTGVKIIKNKNGGAYLMVLIITLALFLMISTALSVTATSRNLTVRTINTSNLYDIATLGNEQVAAKLNYFSNYLYFDNYLMESLMNNLASTNMYEGAISNRINNPELRSLYFNWTFSSSITSSQGNVYNYNFTAATRVAHTKINHSTTLNPNNCYFYSILNYTTIPQVFIVTTTLNSYFGNIIVESFIVWNDKNLINSLDYYTLTMVRLIRIAD